MNLQEYNKAVESLEEQRLELSQVELDTPSTWLVRGRGTLT